MFNPILLIWAAGVLFVCGVTVMAQKPQFEEEWKRFQDNLGHYMTKAGDVCPMNTTSLQTRNEIISIQKNAEECLREETQRYMIMGYNNIKVSKDASTAVINLQTGTPLNRRQIEAFRQLIASPACKYVGRVFYCIPLSKLRQIHDCARIKIFEKAMDYLEFLTKSLCVNDGDTLADLAAAAVTPCGQSLYSNGVECLNKAGIFTAEKPPGTVVEFCDSLAAGHKCVSETLKKASGTNCESENPSLIVSEVLGNAKGWISTNCPLSVSSVGKNYNLQSFQMTFIVLWIGLGVFNV